MRLASLRPSHSSERKSLTSPAIFQGHSDRISTGERSTPETPATMFFQNGCRPIPTGLTTPMPVTTTRRLFIDCISSSSGGDKIVHWQVAKLRHFPPDKAPHDGRTIQKCRRE